MTDRTPKNLLLITHNYKPEIVGSAYYCSDLAEWFSHHGTEVAALTNRPYYPAYHVFPGYENGQNDDEVICQVRVLRLPTIAVRGGGAISRLASESYFLFQGVFALLSGRVKRRKTVVSVCPTIFAVLLGWLATKRGGHHVAIVHDIQSGLAAGLGMLRYRLLLSSFRLLERFCLNRTDNVVVLSDQMKKALLKLGVRQPISVLPIWVDEKIIFPQQIKDSPNPVLLYNGNLGRKQGLDQLLDLAEILGHEHPDARLLIRGSGTQEGALKESVKERTLNNVEFEPLLAPEKFNDGLADGDIHLVRNSPNQFYI